MDCAVNSCLKSGIKLVILTRVGGFRYRGSQHTLREKASPRFSYSERTNVRMFVKYNQAARYKCTIGLPGWDPIGYSVKKSFNNSAKYFAVLPKFKNPPLWGFWVRTASSQTPRKFLHNLFDHILRNIHRNINRRFVVCLQHRTGGIFFVQVFPRQDRCDGFINNSRLIQCQFLGF